MTENYNVVAPVSNVNESMTLSEAPNVVQEVAASNEPAIDKLANPGDEIASNRSKPKSGRRVITASTSMRNLKKISITRQNNELRAINQENTVRKPRRPVPPQLSDFRDEEDNTLRLADLFADVDTGR